MEAQNIGNSLKAKRCGLLLSRKSVEEHTGVKAPALYKYECGETSPRLVDVVKLADFYDCSLDELVGRN